MKPIAASQLQTRKILLRIVPLLVVGVAMMMMPDVSSSSLYYSANSFTYAFGPLAIFYSLAARAVFPVVRYSKTRLLRLENEDTSSHSPMIQFPHQATISPRFAIVTGANTGIGYETARALVQNHHVSVILACRSRDKALAAAKRINGSARGETKSHEHVAQAIVLSTPLDLTVPESISQFVKDVKQQGYKIDVLVNNAGRNTHPESSDDDSTTTHRNGLFQANFLGHYQLTAELMRHQLLESKAARIVNLSSIMHHFVGSHVNVASPHVWQQVMQGVPSLSDNTYAMSKLAMILFSHELNRRYGVAGVRAVAVNPGAVNSDIWRSMPSWLACLFRIFYLTPEEGAAVVVAAAVGNLPQPDKANNLQSLYLQPYPIPLQDSNDDERRFSTIRNAFHTLAEIMGPFAGARVGRPRLPYNDGDAAAAAHALWETSQQTTGVEWPVNI
ncbi:hypothetical protein MPSEU_000009400 [Mayamaea pseudoterrestris]|nr:hypothetical protein MPSEU_000009400 [Mayamaea pseudoterrestris]